jgi:hypothetical protein
MTPDLVMPRDAQFHAATAGAFLVTVVGICAGIGAAIGAAAGRVGLGIGIGAIVGVPAAVAAVIVRYRNA